MDQNQNAVNATDQPKEVNPVEQLKKDFYYAGFGKQYDKEIDDMHAQKLASKDIVVDPVKKGEDTLSEVISVKMDKNGVYHLNGYTTVMQPGIELQAFRFKSEEQAISVSTKELERMFKSVDWKFVPASETPTPEEMAKVKEQEALLRLAAKLPEIDLQAGSTVREQLAVKYLGESQFKNVFGDYEQLKAQHTPAPLQMYSPYTFNEKYDREQTYHLLQGRPVQTLYRPYTAPEKLKEILASNDQEKIDTTMAFKAYAALKMDTQTDKGNIVRYFYDKEIQRVNATPARFQLEERALKFAIIDLQNVVERPAFFRDLNNGSVKDISFINAENKIQKGTLELNIYMGKPSLTFRDEDGIFMKHTVIKQVSLEQAKSADKNIDNIFQRPATVGSTAAGQAESQQIHQTSNVSAAPLNGTNSKVSESKIEVSTPAAAQDITRGNASRKGKSADKGVAGAEMSM